MFGDDCEIEVVNALRNFLGEHILGNEDAIDLLLVGLIAGGHVLIEGPPGTGKTTLVRLLSEAIGGEFRRVQFTPDLLPSDIVGCSVYDQGQASFRFEAGPVFVVHLKVVALVGGDVGEGVVAAEGEVFFLGAGADGGVGLGVEVAPVFVEGGRGFGNGDWVGEGGEVVGSDAELAGGGGGEC
jgi:hypothetical protein